MSQTTDTHNHLMPIYYLAASHPPSHLSQASTTQDPRSYPQQNETGGHPFFAQNDLWRAEGGAGAAAAA
ncbi:hypothetical protein EYC84_006900 [Monilinia fructicola]|uniref:Uncharacterized protein n=1 Tax=Monilinia fructicola TaxID=38448 RepID=A0A5M9KD24_MONFR|nr:hypothetical protein EYC84_006900 [Monilinia fructicola]